MLSGEALRETVGEQAYARGVQLFHRAMVRERERTVKEVSYTVMDGDRQYRVTVTPLDAECNCGETGCCHRVAAVLSASASGAMTEMEQYLVRSCGPDFLDSVAGILPVSDGIILRPVILYQNGEIYIALRAGEDKLYVVRSIPRFLEARETGEEVPFGKGFTYKPSWMRFSKEAENLLDILSEYCQDSDRTAATGTAARIMHLRSRTARRVLEALTNMEFELRVGEESLVCTGIEDFQADFLFTFSGSFHELRLMCDVPSDLKTICGLKEFVWTDGAIRRVPEKDRPIVEALAKYSRRGRALFIFSEKEVPRVLSELVPYLLSCGRVTLDEALEKRMIRLPLDARIYLDREGADVTCRVAFKYGDVEIDPFDRASDEQMMLIIRDVRREYAVLDELAATGFHVQSGRVYLRGSDRIYDFITEGVERLGALAELYMSRDFRRITVHKPKLKGFLHFSNGQLQLELTDGDERIDELFPLMEALRRHRRYFRYRDGTFIDLGSLEDWHELAEAVSEAHDLTGREDDLGACRTAYLSVLIKEKLLPIEQDEMTQQVAELRFEEPEAPLDCLRAYQKRGFAWLCALHRMRLGGILADEMGLGKTVEMISVILHSCLNEEEKLPSLVVTPTTLTYNWLSEFKRFAPGLKVLLISGTQNARREQIEKITLSTGPDVVITSYPLIRRDIDLMRTIHFRYAVLDEAQHVKNAQSVGAHAVKQIQADTHIAMTGTPMENHPGELWSLFDFALPGYLPQYNEFMRRYGDGQNEESLRRRIRPFLMRRLKKDVLGELPEKQESVLFAEMSMEQRQIYDASMLQKRARVRELLAEKGLGRSHGEVLSAITELREICCHPLLCLPDYRGASGKLEMLMELLPSAVASNRRILLFSQFTSMLKMILRRLEQEGYRALYLDGDTPAAERLDLSERFNAGEGEIFLISLKAGGTGLNLTGADMVIHYDPWWNPTAEDQATGRAHRIGQTRQVEVWKLITHDSIEEQVLKMSERKRKMFDRLITPGETMPSRLTEKDILALFD